VDKRCPKCDLWSSPRATRCDCGYDFASGRQEGSHLSEGERATKGRNRGRGLGLGLGALFISLGGAGFAYSTFLRPGSGGSPSAALESLVSAGALMVMSAASLLVGGFFLILLLAKR